MWTAHLHVLYCFQEMRLEEWDVNLQKRWLSAGEDCSVLQSRVWLLMVFTWLFQSFSEFSLRIPERPLGCLSALPARSRAPLCSLRREAGTRKSTEQPSLPWVPAWDGNRHPLGVHHGLPRCLLGERCWRRAGCKPWPWGVPTRGLACSHGQSPEPIGVLLRTWSP